MSEKAIHVLLIEGDADDSSVIKESLLGSSQWGRTFAVKEAARLSAASRLIAQERFDAIVLDLSLARSVGLQGFREVRELAPETPILILTGLQDEAVAVAAVREGAQDYVVRGTPDCCLLKRAVRHAVERGRLAREIVRLLDGDGVAKLVVDDAGGVLYVNPAAESLLGLAAKSILNRPFAHPLAPPAPGRLTISVPGAPERTVEISSGSIAWGGGEARLVSLRVVVDPARAGEPGEEAREDLRIAERKSQFMARISHELRNTLATVKTAVFCLNDGLTGPLTPRQSRLVDMISRNVDRQVKIIDNILDLARFQSGKIKVVARPVALPRIIDEISQEFRIKNKERRLVLDLPDELPAVSGDADLLVQVLRNLLDNAFRYARSRVIIRAVESGAEEVAVSVVDDGAGIPKERIGELFNQFVQLDRPRDGAGYKGTGLGLAICKEIIEGHRGRVWAESADGVGASFSFTLPRISSTEAFAGADGRHIAFKNK